MTVFILFVLWWFIGIVTGSIVPEIGVYYLVPACTVLLTLCFSLHKRRIRKALIIFLISVLGLTLGVNHIQSKSIPKHIDLTDQLTMLGWVRELKDWGRNQQIILEVRGLKSGEINTAVNFPVLLKASVDLKNSIVLNQYLSVTTSLASLEDKKSFGEFNEARYWKSYGIHFFSRVKNTQIIPLNRFKNRRLSDFFAESGRRLDNRIRQLQLSSENVSILMAMLTGDKKDLSTQQKDLFSRLGLMHLLAVSGLHVGLIFVLLSRLLIVLGLPASRWLHHLISVAGIWIYVGLCGFSPSACRAAAMLLVYSMSTLADRRAKGPQVLFLVAFLHSLWSPYAVFSIGFQLSYLAVLGILVGMPLFTRLIPSASLVWTKVVAYISLPLSAQLFTLPFTLYYFGQFPVFFLLANVFLMPLGLLVYYLGLVCLLVHSLPLSFFLFDRILNLLINVWLGLGAEMASLPGSIIVLESYPWAFVVGFVGMLFFGRKGIRPIVLRPASLLIWVSIWSLHGFLMLFFSKQ